MAKQKRRIETSKFALHTILAVGITGLAASVVGWFKGLPEAPAMAGVFAGLILAEVGFYTWKARAENIMKNPKTHPYKDEPAPQDSTSYGGYGGYSAY
jgi:hypothetical protein